MRRMNRIYFVGVLVFMFCLPLFLSAQEKKEGEEIYTIKKGDTLWDISSKFLKDPFLWPKLWQRNPYITNPHWIYPGRPITLVPLEEPKKVAEEPKKEPPSPPPPKEVVVQKVVPPVEAKPVVKPTEEKPVGWPDTRSAGFVSDVEYPGIGIVLDSKEGKNLMAEGDIMYLGFKKEEQVLVGDKFTVFRGSTDLLRHPFTGQKVGRRYNILGNIQIIDIHGNFYTAKVFEAFEEIQKGDRLKPYEKDRMEGFIGKK